MKGRTLLDLPNEWLLLRSRNHFLLAFELQLGIGPIVALLLDLLPSLLDSLGGRVCASLCHFLSERSLLSGSGQSLKLLLRSLHLENRARSCLVLNNLLVDLRGEYALVLLSLEPVLFRVLVLLFVLPGLDVQVLVVISGETEELVTVHEELLVLFLQGLWEVGEFLILGSVLRFLLEALLSVGWVEQDTHYIDVRVVEQLLPSLVRELLRHFGDFGLKSRLLGGSLL